MKILVTESYSPESLVQLQSFGFSVVSTSPRLDNYTIDGSEIEGALIRSKTKVDAHFLNQVPSIKVIVTATSGFDHIDLKECQKRNVQVMYTPEANTESAAELTLLMMLNLQRQFLALSSQIRQGLWRPESLRGNELQGQTLGIIGFGRVGRRVATLCKVFGLRMIAHDPYIDHDVFVTHEVEPAGLTETLCQSDILTLHVPLTQKTKEMINHQTLNYCQDHCVLINASRGEVINEDDLLYFLKNRKIRAAALDVFATEPLPSNSQLLQQENLVVSPHIGGFTHQAWARASMQASQKLIDYLTKDETSDVLPPQATWYEG